MSIDDVIVCITNHNSSDNAIYLKENFSKYLDTIIIDSKSDEILDEFDIKLDNVYYTGLFNESVRQAKLRSKEYLFFIASDVYIENFDKVISIIKELGNNVHLWAPSSRGQSHLHCKNKGTDNVRECPYLEGFTFLTKVSNCDFIYPVDLDKNKFGYGIDLLLGYNCIRNNESLCLVDDRVEVYHKEGTGYCQVEALMSMYDWMMNDFDDGVKEYTVCYSQSPGYESLLKKLKR